MTAFRLNYLFYAGIILPTVVTLALFVFFVLCWRKQSARKAVLTKLYDPHGTMRRLGIPNTPPPPPVFLRGGMTPTSPTAESGGEDNAAYDMSRSPSAEATAAGGAAAGRQQQQQFHAAPPDYTATKQLTLTGSPTADLDLASRLAFHSRLDSGLSEPATCESPGGASLGGAGGGGGGGGGNGSRDRPQSRTSHSSHSTDSEDSGFRSSRSGHLTHGGHMGDLPVLKRSRSAGRNKGRGYYHKAATSSPDSDTEPSLPLTPTALWSSHNHHHHHHHHQKDPTSAGLHHPVKPGDVDLHDISTHLGWKYLQDLHSPAHRAKEKAAAAAAAGPGCPDHRQTLTCHQSMTLAQVHTSHDLDNPDVFGFSVV